MAVEFYKEDDKSYHVWVNDNIYGTLTFDEDQGDWVLYPNKIDDGITYFNSLKDTEETITDELHYYQNDNEF